MEYAIQLTEHQEELLAASGMTIRSIVEDKLQQFESVLRDKKEKELLAKAERAATADPVAFEELAKEEVKVEEPKEDEKPVEGEVEE